MKLAIIKAIISWLWRHHKFLLYEAVVPEGHHIHKNPPGKPHAKYSDLIPLANAESEYASKPCPACGVEGGRCAC